MKPSELTRKLHCLLHLCIDVARLPHAHLHFDRRLEPVHVAATHANFTRRHPRYRLIRNKTIGMALVDLSNFKTDNDYLDTVRKKDHAAYHGRRARARGYTVCEIDRNYFVEDIHAINTSQPVRQGRPMDAQYLHKAEHFEDRPHFRYFGVRDGSGRLAAYCNLGVFGNFAATDQLLGRKNGDGVMYLLLMEIICRLIEEKRIDYLMYDSFLGAQPGLRSFKQRVGFRPFRVHYTIQ
jgi:hypothetical protein